MVGKWRKFFHSTSSKMALNSISFSFLSYWITSDLNLILRDFFKNCVKELYKKSFENKLSGIPHTRIKGSSLLL